MLEASLPDVTAGIAANGEDYDFRYLLHAGYDESGVWQEFGEMLFASREDVPDSGLGNPDPALPEWVDSRYRDRWTAFAAGEGIWSHAIPGVFSTQGENGGSSVFAHELSHIFGVLDNYNDPYGVPVPRSYSGPWDMLSRGAFNGPGGPHTRWLVPANQGASMGSHHMLRNKLRLGFSQIGRSAAVADSVVAELEAAGHDPRRLAGEDRYATSVAIGDEAIASGMAATQLWLATGLDWPDALAAGPAVAALGDTFLLVHGEDLTASPATEQVLRERAEALDTIRLVGGTAAIAESVLEQIRSATAPD